MNDINIPLRSRVNTEEIGSKETGVCLSAVVVAAIAVALFSPEASAVVHTNGLDISAGSTTLNAGDIFNVGIDDMVQVSTKRGGIRVQKDAVVNVTDNGGITVTVGSPADLAGSGYSSRGIWVDTGAQVDLGIGSTIKMYVDSNVQGIGISNQGTFKAHLIDVSMSGDSSIALVSAADGAHSDLGSGSRLVGGQAAISTYNGGTTIARDAFLKSTRDDRGTIHIADGTVTLTNSTVESDGMGIELAAGGVSSGKLGTVNIVGGSVYAKAGAAVSSVSGNSISYNHVVNITEGAVVASDSGVLYSDDGVHAGSADSTVNLIVSGDGTSVAGRIHSKAESNKKLILDLSDNATWSSAGYSNLDTLILDNANIQFSVTSTVDMIAARELIATGDNVIHVDFSDSFISEIIDIIPYSGIALEAVEGLLTNVTFVYATGNQNYNWTVVNNGDGSYTISDIIAVPEPATYAAVIGAAIFSLSLIHRRIRYAKA